MNLCSHVLFKDILKLRCLESLEIKSYMYEWIVMYLNDTEKTSFAIYFEQNIMKKCVFHMIEAVC